MDRTVWRLALENGNYELLAFQGKERDIDNVNGDKAMEIDEGQIKLKDGYVFFKQTRNLVLALRLASQQAISP